MRAPHATLPGSLYLVAGVDSLRIRPLVNASNPADSTHRSFVATYRARVTDYSGGPPGTPEGELVVLVRRPAGPWQVSSVSDGP